MSVFTFSVILWVSLPCSLLVELNSSSLHGSPVNNIASSTLCSTRGREGEAAASCSISLVICHRQHTHKLCLAGVQYNSVILYVYFLHVSWLTSASDSNQTDFIPVWTVCLTCQTPTSVSISIVTTTDGASAVTSFTLSEITSPGITVVTPTMVSAGSSSPTKTSEDDYLSLGLKII